MLIISKFGGSSLADGGCFATVREILRQDPSRQGVVVSAPGKRNQEDEKITDLLYACHDRRSNHGDWESVFSRIARRFTGIAEECGLEGLFREELDALRRQISQGVSRDFLASRGEYFSAKLMAAYLGREFIDSALWLRMTADGGVDTVRSYGALRRLAQKPFVTPGFYGADASGEIRTFPRGGSDITGALAAAALDADLYENWTDVPGILQVDPRIHPQARTVRYLTYGELAELGAVGTQVLHEGAVRPVRDAEIPMQIRSTKIPEDPGTRIMKALPSGLSRRTLLCFAGRRERALISLSDAGLAPGTLEKILREAGVVPDFSTNMFHRQTVAVPSGALEDVMDRLNPCPGELRVRDNIALVAVIFNKSAEHGPRGADLMAALKTAGVSLAAVLRPFDGHTLVLAVPDRDYLTVLRAFWELAEE